MNLSSKATLIARLRRGRKTREAFVESHLAKTIAHQIRAMRESAGWSQTQLAEAIGTNQNGVYRLESTSYGRPTLTTLKRVASAFDVALIVRFAPFGELIDWVSGTPRLDRGLRTAAIDVENFEKENGEAAEIGGDAMSVVASSADYASVGTAGLDSIKLRMVRAEHLHYGHVVDDGNGTSERTKYVAA